MSSAHDPNQAIAQEAQFEQGIDIRELFQRIRRGTAQILAFGAIGMVAALCVVLIATPWRSANTMTRITFAFEGLERGQYPDRSKFQAEDLRAPDVVLEALQRRKFEISEAMQSRIRSALYVEGIIPPEISKQRDRLRASGQNPPVYVPDEYMLSLLLPRGFSLSFAERERFVSELVVVFREKFLRTYGTLPQSIGNAFDALAGADFYEYELILKQDLRNTIDYLTQQIETDKTFRSQTTNLSFSDLLKETQIFSQVRMFDTLGHIHSVGLSRNRHTAMVKLDYSLRTVADRLTEAVESEKVIQVLLKQSQERGQGYVLGLKSQAAEQRSSAPLVDQGLIDSLLANDAYNFLVRQALETGLRVKRIETELSDIVNRREAMNKFLEEDPLQQAAMIELVTKSLSELKTAYTKLIDNISRTRADYSRQKFGDVARLSAELRTEGIYKTLLIFGSIGIVLGVSLGAGLSMLRLYVR